MAVSASALANFLATSFSASVKSVLASIAFSFSAKALSIAALACSLPNGFTALIAVSPFAWAAFTASCVSAFWMASTASIAALATSALADAFSSSDKLLFLSISANLASVVV